MLACTPLVAACAIAACSCPTPPTHCVCLLPPLQEIFEHLALRFEKEAILELDDVERDLNLPVTPIPELVVKELAQ